LPDELAPFHYDDFQRAAQTLVVAVTDCATGRPVYFRQHDHDGRWFVRAVQRASSSLPVLSPPVRIEGRRYLDGGVSDPLPLDRSIADGNLRNVVVLTRNAGYRKEQQPGWLGPLAALALPRYPRLRRAMRERHLKYNASLDRLVTLEQAGQAFVLRPLKPVVVDRLERDVAALDALYRQGYEETLERMAELKAWLEAPA
jgi:predicted patatin/cPLA2 family phospholipase